MVKKVLKGILLWITILAIILFVIGVDSILDGGAVSFFAWGLLCISLTNLCYNLISREELYVLSGMKLIEKYMN